MNRSKALAAAALVAAVGAGVLLTAGRTEARASQTIAGPGEFQIDSVHSMIVFRIKHVGVSYTYGMIHQPEGSYTLDFENPSNSTLEVKAMVEKIDTGHDGRDKHLKSPDFFSSRQFPEISFKGASFEKTGEHTMKVTGDLTLLGKTNTIETEVSWVGEAQTRQGHKSGFEAEFTIERSKWGMTKYIEEGGLGDEVTLYVTIEGNGAAAE